MLEGAGSPAEINLREHDIVNMRMAHAANAACVLVGDIDRGGVFASLLGTLAASGAGRSRAASAAYTINKFRGDVSLLSRVSRMIEPRSAFPARRGALPARSWTRRRRWRRPRRPANRRPGVERIDAGSGPARPLRIAVVALPHLSNFTDFDPLAAEPSVSLAYVEWQDELPNADLVILPGSKQTIDDLGWLRHRGFDHALRQMHSQGRILMGICGGFQMLGARIEDPQGMESGGTPATCEGLGLLPIQTVLNATKTTRRVQGNCRTAIFGQPQPGLAFQGYEIHVGETLYGAGAEPFAEITREGIGGAVPDGAMSSNGGVAGTYVHGLFDADTFRHAFVDAARAACGLQAAAAHAFVAREREARLDRLAAHVRNSLDLALLWSWIGLPPPRTGTAR